MSEANTSLLIKTPNRIWHCDDDGGEAGANPALFFDQPQSGAYFIWLGASVAGTDAELTFSSTVAR